MREFTEEVAKELLKGFKVIMDDAINQFLDDFRKDLKDIRERDMKSYGIEASARILLKNYSTRNLLELSQDKGLLEDDSTMGLLQHPRDMVMKTKVTDNSMELQEKKIQNGYFMSMGDQFNDVSKYTYRKINRVLAELWLQLVWLVDWCERVTIKVFVVRESFNLMGKVHALVIGNHRSDVDWLVGWVLAQRSGCIGSTLAVRKKSSKFLLDICWSMWFAKHLFLERSWDMDEINQEIHTIPTKPVQGFQFGLAFFPLPL
ncbi:hypothetical protein V6N11_039986 [Hibiscus sabdariffa]|uniref:Phospholipid/glycerol acyltransferase domain-containing protein n=1 Tax=Hibiscus sabdariffa TaxID=183260 RepID=A0ABR2RG42_9ROSI